MARIALVTGGTRGIGAAIVLALKAAGMSSQCPTTRIWSVSPAAAMAARISSR
jgi:NAD(P)-dependent dehydrogenase (short-subunit alcohol dehydrogenase family)